MNLVLLEPADFVGGDGKTVHLSGRRLEHVRTVCRSSEGDRLRVGMVDGLLGSGSITRLTDALMVASVELSEPPPPPLPLTLIMALPRPKSLKKSIEAATSLGVKSIFIIESWRVDKSYWKSPVLSSESLRAHAILGLEQARDTILPRIIIKRRFRPFVEDELPAIIGGGLALAAHPYDAQPCPFSVEQPVVLAIGPEGGFIPFEIDLLRQAGFTPVTIGQRILRVETAIAAFVGRFW